MKPLSKLNATQKRFVQVLLNEFGVASWDVIGAEGQYALMYMTKDDCNFETLEPLVNALLEKLHKQSEKL
jgi:hypothetical protein